MSAYRTETTAPEKMPVWISPELHRELKLLCVWKDVSIKDFSEDALKEAMRIARDK